MAKKNYYEILNVKKTDSEDVIKKAYKKLAIKYHPDKADDEKKKESEDKFKEINEAYSTLSNKEKRARYDMGGSNQQNQSSGNSQGFRGGFSDIFEELLRGRSGGFSQGEQEEDLDLHYRIIIEFTEAAFGVEKEISVKKNISCKIGRAHV